MVILLKAPDKDKHSVRSYRGICLLPVLGKVLERVMVERVADVVNIERPLSTVRQFGFKPGLSVEDAWMHVKEKVECCPSEYILGIFVDFKGVFDNLNWASIIRRLDEVGCTDLELWKSYFSDRHVCFEGRHDVIWKRVERGCPQGSISGPFIWNLLMDTMLVQLAPLTEYCAYADDLVLLVEGKSRADLERKAGDLMRIVSIWSHLVGVAVAWDKTVMMLLRG